MSCVGANMFTHNYFVNLTSSIMEMLLFGIMLTV